MARPRAVRREGAPAPNARQHLGNVAGVSRRRPFIRDRVDLFFFTRALDHRVDEAGPVRTEYPRHAHHQVSILRLQYQFLASALGFSINADWLCHVAFGVRLTLFAIKHVIGTEMDHLRVFVPADSGKHLRPLGVDRERLLNFLFAKNDIRHRRTVDQQVELEREEVVPSLVLIGEIKLLVIKTGNVEFPLILAHERSAQPATGSNNDDFPFVAAAVTGGRKESAGEDTGSYNAERNS